MMTALFVALSVVATIVNADINFIAVGDWGGQGSSPYYTAAQVKVAAAMNKVAGAVNSKFTLALGDNVYSNGVTNENDSRFKSSFENIYTGENLQSPWLVIAGNHDHNGNVTGQIEYSSHSSRWTFPSAHHAHSYTDGTIKIDVLLIDTIDLSGGINVPEDHPDYFKPLEEKPRSAAATEWTWLEEQMKASSADYILVGGHYPVYSVCEHGPTSSLITNLKPLLETYGAHYIAGHDHCLEHIQETGSKVNYIVTGMGMECCYKNSNLAKNPTNSVQWYIAANNVPKGMTGGFSSISVSKTGMSIVMYDQDGNAVHTVPSIPPRK